MVEEKSWVDIITGLLGATFLLVAILFAYTWAFSVIWNFVIPSLFNGPDINYVESAAIIMGARMLFSPIKFSKSKEV